MSDRRTWPRGIAGAAALFLALAGTAGAQSSDADQARAKELVLRIRKSMREIDSLLLKGSQPEKIESEIAANQKRIEELLQETESKSQTVINSIDELVKLTKYQQSGSSGGGGSPDQKQPPNPQGSLPPRDKSEDPQELSQQPKPQDAQPTPKEQGEEQQQPQPKDGDPNSGRPDPSDPDQRDAKRPPPPSATGEFERTDLSGRWGMLPPKEAEDLQRRNADEFPQRYRQWMELYFRRVNKLPSRDR